MSPYITVTATLLLFLSAHCMCASEPSDEANIVIPALTDRNERGWSKDLGATTDGTEICTKEVLQEFTRSDDFTGPVNFLIKEVDRKKLACIEQKGENSYYDSELRTCGDCFEDDCHKNHICVRECKWILALRDINDKLNSTLEKLEIFQAEAIRKQRESEEKWRDLTPQFFLLQQKAQLIQNLQDNVTQLKMEVQSCQYIAKEVIQLQADGEKIKLLEKQNEELRKNMNIWCGFLTTLIIAGALVLFAWAYFHFNSNRQPSIKTGVQPEAEQGGEEANQGLLTAQHTGQETADEEAGQETANGDAPGIQDQGTNIVLTYERQRS